ncbi:MAG: dihydrofolate reductase [Bacteroidales bacterium]|nr:dihydrofolate reductase [Bacteroidales bacterium]
MTDRQITMIVAVAENGAIGKDNNLLWHISGDLKRFKAITTGHSIIMGRKTYLSFPKHPLPDRKNIILTSGDSIFEGAYTAKNIEQALALCDSDEVFIIGGESVYRQFLPCTTKIYLTRVHRSYEADTFFPTLNMDEWETIETEEHLDGEPPFTYITLRRKEM